MLNEINPDLVNTINSFKANAEAVTARNANSILKVKKAKNPELGFVADPEEIDIDKLNYILNDNKVPVRDIICVGKNYAEHAKEVQRSSFNTLQGKQAVPTKPIIFNKATTSVIGPNDKIETKNDETKTTDYEGELGVIIGKRAKNISKANAFDIIFGYTIINDVTARELQNNHKQWFIGKSPDTYCPMGPAVITKDEINNIDEVKLQTFVNEEERQVGIVKDMVFTIPVLIETLTKSMTLVEGDIIATGTPAGVGIGFDPPKFLKPGDKVKVSIEPIGTLENEVI